MKIFAKRGSKKKPSPVQKPVISEADAAVLKLLKKDPSELNSKQRRMVKRYQDRIDSGSADNKPATDENADVEIQKEKEVREKEIDQNENEEKDIENSENEEESIAKPSVDNPGQLSDTAPIETESADSTNNQLDSSEVDEQKVRTLLEMLNSKNKRKLTRQLEREGNSSLKSIHEEALRLIEEVKASKPDEDPKEKSGAGDTENTDKGNAKSKKRKRSKSVDWSALPAEERLRREEQRRLQKEAAERRARDGHQPNKKHKHPLNSERRRANRRKPKWSNTHKKHHDPNEHDISGYHMRRNLH